MSLIRRSNHLFPGLFDSFEKDFFNDFVSLGNKNLPAVNVLENQDGYSVEVAAPGLKKEDFKVNLENNVLTISSEKQVTTEDKNDKYSIKEFSYNSFKRAFTLPEVIDSEKIEATYQDGILSVKIAKKEEAKRKEPKQIEIA